VKRVDVAPKPITLYTCECGNDTFKVYEIRHRWDPEHRVWFGWDYIHRCTKCGKEYFNEMDQREHPDINYFEREDMKEVRMGREEFIDYISQKEQK